MRNGKKLVWDAMLEANEFDVEFHNLRIGIQGYGRRGTTIERTIPHLSDSSVLKLCTMYSGGVFFYT